MVDNPGGLYSIACEVTKRHLIGSTAFHIDINIYGAYDDCCHLVITEVEPL
jgi:hypothetical protein